MPEILNVLKDRYRHDLSISNKLSLLESELFSGIIQSAPSDEDLEETWKGFMKQYHGERWRHAPFYLVEAYFYRMILEVVDFFHNRRDPFAEVKRNDIALNLDQMEQIFSDSEQANSFDRAGFIKYLVKKNLWGNKSDLSQIELNRNALQEECTLLDDSSSIIEILSNGIKRADIILDNAGMELFTDLLLAYWLVKKQFSEKVVLHAKTWPTFVSDATIEDISVLTDMLAAHSDSAIPRYLEELKCLINEGTIIIKDHAFWNAPLHFYQMPEALANELSRSGMVLIKGDANYRRIFGDRQIPPDFVPKDLISYMQAPTFAIRILKSEIISGLTREQIALLNSSNPDWMISGTYGIIQTIN